jgi:glucoamylase
MARAMGVAGYYVRIAPPPDADGDSVLARILPIKNRACDPGLPAEEQVATDFLQLVRFGLRDPHDPLIVDTLKVVDRQLRVELAAGAAWHRYTGDGYGERPDGSPFEGVGVGRAWPLLAGERGHYELLAGRDPLPFLRSMAAMTGRAGMLPEQVWDADPVPRRGLYPGAPSGSAMPLVWAHAEFVKLAASRALGFPCDRPEAVWQRYHGRRPDPAVVIWTPRFPVAALHPGRQLRVCLCEPAVVRCGTDGWQGTTDLRTRESGLGLHVAELPTAALREGQRVDMTFFWTGSNRWEGRDYAVEIRNGDAS